LFLRAHATGERVGQAPSELERQTLERRADETLLRKARVVIEALYRSLWRHTHAEAFVRGQNDIQVLLGLSELDVASEVSRLRETIGAEIDQFYGLATGMQPRHHLHITFLKCVDLLAKGQSVDPLLALECAHVGIAESSLESNKDLDRLVREWNSRPGAKPSDGRGRRGKWVQAADYINARLGDSTTAAVLEREWREHQRGRRAAGNKLTLTPAAERLLREEHARLDDANRSDSNRVRVSRC
jgi:hypothetical protein